MPYTDIVTVRAAAVSTHCRVNTQHYYIIYYYNFCSANRRAGETFEPREGYSTVKIDRNESRSVAVHGTIYGYYRPRSGAFTNIYTRVYVYT